MSEIIKLAEKNFNKPKEKIKNPKNTGKNAVQPKYIT